MARLSLHAVGGNVTGVLMTSQRPLTHSYTLVSSTHSDMTQHTFVQFIHSDPLQLECKRSMLKQQELHALFVVAGA